MYMYRRPVARMKIMGVQYMGAFIVQLEEESQKLEIIFVGTL